MRIKILLIFLLSLLTPLSFAAGAISDPQGFWQLADNNGNPKIIIRIYSQNQKLYAKLLQYLPNLSARCTECKGDLKDKPYNGLIILSGLTQKDNNTWSGGKILNPETGKTSNVSITINNDGNALTINSYGWFSWFGSKDIWTRRN